MGVDFCTLGEYIDDQSYRGFSDKPLAGLHLNEFIISIVELQLETTTLGTAPGKEHKGPPGIEEEFFDSVLESFDECPNFTRRYLVDAVMPSDNAGIAVLRERAHTDDKRGGDGDLPLMTNSKVLLYLPKDLDEEQYSDASRVHRQMQHVLSIFQECQALAHGPHAVGFVLAKQTEHADTSLRFMFQRREERIVPRVAENLLRAAKQHETQEERDGLRLEFSGAALERWGQLLEAAIIQKTPGLKNEGAGAYNLSGRSRNSFETTYNLAIKMAEESTQFSFPEHLKLRFRGPEGRSGR